jgi:hypothetical protein
MKINKPELAIKILINVLLISLFITVFFFTYAASIEKEVIINQMKFLSEHFSNGINLLGPDLKDYIKSIINNIKTPDMNELDKKTIKNNKKILNTVIKVNILFTIIMCLFIFAILYKYNHKFDFAHVIKENFIILIFIAFTEFAFLSYFGARYISINPNEIKLNIIKQLYH